MKKLIIFGKGPIAQIAKDYFTDDSNYEVVAFTLDKNFILENNYEGLPLVSFDDIEKDYPPKNFEMFIALSYTEMNRLRERKYYEAKNKNYKLATYVSSKCSYLSKNSCGDNCFIFEDNTIQPYAEIGNNVFLWSGNHIGHHSSIMDHNFISSHVVISGQCKIESNCFLGVNSSIAHGIKVAKETLVGAGTTINKNTTAKGVYVAPRPIMLRKHSDEIKL